MSTVFTFNGFSHNANEVAFAGIRREVIFSQTQRPHIMRESWSMKGRIVSQTSGDCFATLAAVRAAYAKPGNYAAMTFDVGASPFIMGNLTNAIGAGDQTIVVTSPVAHGQLTGAEGVTFLNYTFGLQCDTFLSLLTDLLSYHETLTFSDIGGGPIQVYRVPVAGLPVVQSVSTSSFFDATQTGAATSRDPNIRQEDMIFPNFLMGEPGAATVTYSSPRMERGTPTEYGVQWTYRYRSALPLGDVRPHTRG